MEWIKLLDAAYEGAENGAIKRQLAKVWGQGEKGEALIAALTPKVQELTKDLLAFGKVSPEQLRGALDAELASVESAQSKGQESSRGASSFDTFKLDLAGVDPRGVQDAVVRKMVNLHGASLQFADQMLLREWYNQIKDSPSTVTQIAIKDQYGLSFNRFFAANPSRGALLHAFHRTTGKPVLVKFGQELGIIGREYHAMIRAANAPHMPVPFELIIPSKKSRASLPAKGGFLAVNLKLGIQMPLYPATLAHIKPPLTAELALKIGQQVLQCLDHIHAMEGSLAHNDIKSTNIFINADGDAIVGDWGAAQDTGKIPHEMTPTHWCKDLPKIGTAQTDRMQLLITLLERLDLYPGFTPQASSELMGSLVQMVHDPELKAFLQSLLE